jgi:2'-5' RNA ligase
VARDRASRPEAKPRRLFVAFEVPEEAKTAATKAAETLRERFPRARWVPPENLHVTMKFLGSVWPRLTSWVPDRLERAAADLAPFDVGLDGLGAFRSPRSARVVWVGLRDEPAGAMASTAAGIDTSLAAEFPLETRPFSAHLTLARSDPPLTLTSEDLEVIVPPVTWTVRELVFVQSHLRRPAPRYEVVGRFGLGLQP